MDDSTKEFIKLLEEALTNESLIDKIAEKVAAKCAKVERMPLVEVWENGLSRAELSLAQDVKLERVVELYPLSRKEIKIVVDRIKTSGFKDRLGFENIRKFVIEQLGDDELMSRLATIQKSREIPALREKARCGQVFTDCGAVHGCGQPYHCGPDFYCSAQKECGWRFEFWPCVSSEIHCAKHDHSLD